MFGFLTCLNLCCAMLGFKEFAESQEVNDFYIGVFNMVVACICSYTWGKYK